MYVFCKIDQLQHNYYALLDREYIHTIANKILTLFLILCSIIKFNVYLTYFFIKKNKNQLICNSFELKRMVNNFMRVSEVF